MDWKEAKNNEMQFLLGEYKKNPSLFEYETFVDDPDFLKEFGIAIPNKENFPRAYLKFLPQDFIVEEVTKDGTILTADKESNFPSSSVEIAGDTVYATLVKCNIATFDAIKEISRQTDSKIEQIQYAGIKDKAAITSQRISIRRVPKEKIEAISSEFFFLKDISTGKGVVEKGGLTGNRFTILLRTEGSLIDEDQKQGLLEAFDKVMKNGFYNFFYLQRFGSPRLTNFRWGFHVLKGDYKEALRERLFEPGLRESTYFQNLRKNTDAFFGDWVKVKEAFAPFPLICHQEHTLIDYMLEHPTDYLGALKQLPDQVCLWVYGLEALLYNQLLSNFIVREQVPERLPMSINNLPQNWAFYKTELQELGIYPPPIQNLRPFPMRLAAPLMETRDRPIMENIEVISEGVIMQFRLKKGEYATTFLSHLFNLTSGKPPADIFREPKDIKEPLGEKDFAKTLEIFAPIIRPKVDNFIEMFKNQE